MIMFTKRFPIYPIIPTVYENALSYLEELIKLNQKINELVQTLDDNNEELFNELQVFVLERLSEMRTENQTAFASLNGAIEQVQTLTEQEIKKLEANIVQMYQVIYKSRDDLEIKFKLLESEIWRYVKGLDYAANIYVTNPVTGRKDTLQNTLNQMYNKLNSGGLTAFEYDQLALTAEEYDSCHLEAFTYDTRARWTFFQRMYLSMFSPLNGKYQSMKEVILELAGLHKDDPITAAEYDALDLTASAYDGKLLSAFLYDFRAKLYLTS